MCHEKARTRAFFLAEFSRPGYGLSYYEIMERDVMNSFRILLPLFCVASFQCQAEEVYRTVDESGNVIYSDQPSEDAEKINIDNVQTITLPTAPEFSYTPPAQEAGPYYTRVEVSSPANDATIRPEDEDLVKVNLAIEPSLAGNDTVLLFLDGHQVASATSTSFDLPNVDRGTHLLTATIRGPDGTVRGQSSPSSFHLQRVSVLTKPAPKPKH